MVSKLFMLGLKSISVKEITFKAVCILLVGVAKTEGRERGVRKKREEKREEEREREMKNRRKEN